MSDNTTYWRPPRERFAGQPRPLLGLALVLCLALGCTEADDGGTAGSSITGGSAAAGFGGFGGAAGAFGGAGGAGAAGSAAIGAGAAASPGFAGSGGAMPAAGVGPTGGAATAGFGGSGGVLAGAGGAGGTAGDAIDAGMATAGVDASVAGAGGADAGAPVGFMPCPTGEPCKILPLGDSITDGIGFSGGYRVELFRSAIADGHDITFVGGSMNGPSMVDGVSFPRNHEGHSGWTIGQVDDIVPSPALGPEPHIVLLHLGTNDMYRTPAGAPERLGALIDQIVTELPDALLVVSTIIPFPGGASAVDTFNAGVPPVVEARIADGKHVMLVDQFTGFPTSELGDGVHPNEAGYARMAGVWYAAIEDVLP